MPSRIGRYEILHELGRGAMGVVYAAKDPAIGRTVAIKTVRIADLQEESDREQLRHRLRREAQSAGILSHPGIVTIHDVGGEQDQAYIVMELVEGTNLETILSSGTPQHTGMLLRILRQASEALDYAHSKELIHRDIKPSNIMITKDGAAKITDFGVAKFSASTALTQTGLVMGTPNYMSPEQAQGRMIDGRSDQFSLAVVAFRMLTGQLPFTGPTLTAVLSKILWEEPEYLAQIKDPEVRAVLRKALAKEPTSRFSTCGEFSDALWQAYSVSRQEVQGKTGERAGSPPARPGDDGAVNESVSPAEMEIRRPEELREPGAAVAASGEASLAALLAPTQPLHARRTDDAVAAPALPEAEPPSAPPEAPLNVQDWDATPVLLSEDQPQPVKTPSRTAVAVGAVIAFVVLSGVLLAMLTLRKPVPATETSPTQQPPTSVAPASPPAPSSQSAPTVQELYPAIDAVKGSASAPPVKSDKPALQKREQTTQLSSSIARAPATSPEKRPGEAAPKPLMTGALTWTGRMLKNSLLVIEGQQASHGAVDGQLPGMPVTIVVDPPSVQIREVPNEMNGWKRLMLYSGNQRYSSITIRWTATK